MIFPQNRILIKLNFQLHVFFQIGFWNILFVKIAVSFMLAFSKCNKNETGRVSPRPEAQEKKECRCTGMLLPSMIPNCPSSLSLQLQIQVLICSWQFRFWSVASNSGSASDTNIPKDYPLRRQVKHTTRSFGTTPCGQRCNQILMSPTGKNNKGEVIVKYP